MLHELIECNVDSTDIFLCLPQLSAFFLGNVNTFSRERGMMI